AVFLCPLSPPARRDSTVDRDHEAAAVACKAHERVTGDAVSLLESAREVPGDLRPKLAKHENGERGCADPVGVVIAVDADLLFRCDCGTNPFTGGGRVAEPGGIVVRGGAGHEGARSLG